MGTALQPAGSPQLPPAALPALSGSRSTCRRNHRFPTPGEPSGHGRGRAIPTPRHPALLRPSVALPHRHRWPGRARRAAAAGPRAGGGGSGAGGRSPPGDSCAPLALVRRLARPRSSGRWRRTSGLWERCRSAAQPPQPPGCPPAALPPCGSRRGGAAGRSWRSAWP